MARLFFDMSIDGNPMLDRDGLEYADLTRALRDARASLAALVAEALGQDTDHDAHHCAITVRDDRGQIVTRLHAELREERSTPSDV